MKKPIKLDKDHVSTHSAEVGQPAEKHQQANEESSSDEESSSNGFQGDADDPDCVDEEEMGLAVSPSSTEEVKDVPEGPNVIGVVDSDDDNSGQMTSHPRIRNQNQSDNVINPRLPKPKMKYETILIYNFGTNKDAPKRQGFVTS